MRLPALNVMCHAHQLALLLEPQLAVLLVVLKDILQ